VKVKSGEAGTGATRSVSEHGEAPPFDRSEQAVETAATGGADAATNDNTINSACHIHLARAYMIVSFPVLDCAR
jgi:hypothetical protein